MLWYPLACLAAAAAFAAWVWMDCGSVKAVANCRSEIAAETTWAFGIVLAIGLAILGAVWFATLPFDRRRGRGLADDAFEATAIDVDMPPRSAGHARSGDARPG
jgi:hypothetical protein